MKAFKRILGLVWIILGPLSTIFMFWQAWDKISSAPAGIAQTNTTLQWGIILLIFLPIAVGLMIFGKYALAGEFDELPTNSEEL